MSSNVALTGNFFFGWDLLYSTIEAKVDKKSDVLIALAHFVLIKHSHFQCIGVGEDKTLSEDEVGSEMLPAGWNDNEKKYALRYLNDNKLYLLLGHKSEDCLIINLLDVGTKKVSNIAIEPEDLVKQLKGPISKMVPSASQLVDRFSKELVEPVFKGNTRECTTQTTITPAGADPMRVDPLRIGDPMRAGPYMPRGTYPRNFGFPDVGRGDLDPLGRGGPGNLMPFPSRPNFGGGGSFPRFDPFGPPEPNIRPNPNPDHLPPPNFGGDDFYM